MKRYCIKCPNDRKEYMDIIGESEESYNIRIFRLSDGSEKISEDTITRNLFNICLKTGYISEMPIAQVA